MVMEPVTVGADKNYDTRDFVAKARDRKATPHVAMAQNTERPRLNVAVTKSKVAEKDQLPGE